MTETVRARAAANVLKLDLIAAGLGVMLFIPTVVGPTTNTSSIQMWIVAFFALAAVGLFVAFLALKYGTNRDSSNR
jgi:hypothetical protein